MPGTQKVPQCAEQKALTLVDAKACLLQEAFRDALAQRVLPWVPTGATPSVWVLFTAALSTLGPKTGIQQVLNRYLQN